MTRHGRCAAAALSDLTVWTTGGAVAPPPWLQASANAMHDRSGSKGEELRVSMMSPLTLQQQTLKQAFCAALGQSKSRDNLLEHLCKRMYQLNQVG